MSSRAPHLTIEQAPRGSGKILVDHAAIWLPEVAFRRRQGRRLGRLRAMSTTGRPSHSLTLLTTLAISSTHPSARDVDTGSYRYPPDPTPGVAAVVDILE